MKPKLIERDGQWFAQIPVRDFETLLRNAAAGEKAAPARKQPPAEIATRVANGDNRIRAFREYMGLTQKQLALAAGIARPFLTEIETGRKSGSVASLKAIARALDVELEEIA